MKKVVGLMIGLLPVSVSAECVPVPDCAMIGYTETSCDGDSLKCPFDTTKLRCLPCDSSFRFSCDGENVASVVGNSCNSKYVACNCITGATFINGECFCDTSCGTVGNIYYSDGSCSSCNDTSKTAVGVVVADDFILSNKIVSIYWAADNVNLESLEDYANGDSAKTDYNGRQNTQKIVAHYGDMAEKNAAVYCYNYAPLGLENSKGQWYLPAAGELYDYVFKNYDKLVDVYKNNFNLSIRKYVWSSTEKNRNDAHEVGLYDGGFSNTWYKTHNSNLMCMLKI